MVVYQSKKKQTNKEQEPIMASAKEIIKIHLGARMVEEEGDYHGLQTTNLRLNLSKCANRDVAHLTLSRPCQIYPE